MSNVNISLSKEAYDFLKVLKGREKSFSEVVIEFKERDREKKGSKEKLMKYFGALKGREVDWKAKEKRMEEFREELEKRFKK